MNKNYLLKKNTDTNEIVYIAYDKLDGYQVKPKVNKKDTIEVSQIVFINPSFSEKIIKKKVELQIRKLMEIMQHYDTDETASDAGGIRRNLMDAERLKLKIINDYVKYLGHDFASLSLDKLQLIIDSLRGQLISCNKQKMIMSNYNFMPFYGEMNEEVSDNRGRKGR